MLKIDKARSIHDRAGVSPKLTYTRLVFVAAVLLTISSCALDHVSGEIFVVRPDSADASADANPEAARTVVEKPSAEGKPSSRAAK